jgi:mono/diheme cytochrome c family protein
MLAAGDSMAVQLFEEFNQVPMPNLGLTDAQVAALIAYLEMQAGGGALREAPLPQPAQPQPVQGSPPLRIGGGAGGGGLELPPGDPMIGKELFNGMLRFQNGGPPCMACHSVTGIGALGGGALGPDLTPAVEKYGGAKGLDAFLGGVPTATMNAIWSQKPLTPEERANILAFLQQAAVQRRPSRAVWTLTGLAVGGLVVLLVLAQLVWHRRLIEVRRPMLRQTA